MSSHDFLLEIGVEELPSGSLVKLATALQKNLLECLKNVSIPAGECSYYVTPRRIAVIIRDVAQRQPAQRIERQGPAAASAFDKDGTPTLACIGFARSCGVTADQLKIRDTDKGKRVYCCIEQIGEATLDLLPEIIQQAIAKLPISKPMRWGKHEYSFVRPVHWLVALFGENTIALRQFGITASNTTYGHRFHYHRHITINHPLDYEKILHKAFVIAAFEQRKQEILKQIKQHEKTDNIHAIIDHALLDEVTALVEWPVVLIGQFHKDFLKIPAEVLITSMKNHQKCFPVCNDKHQLLPCFIMVSNIESTNPQAVITGNERVINARLNDAAFFFNNDIAKPLNYFNKQLQHVVFQKSLGTLHDRVMRITKLSGSIATALHENITLVKHAAALTKFDLVSEMVGEFPELQGVMGYHYAKHAGETAPTTDAIREHYYPRFSGDRLPNTIAGTIIALADRLDLLVGIFGINKIPSGEKDPYGLRRAAQGVIRLLIEKKIPLDLKILLKTAYAGYTNHLSNKEVLTQAMLFIFDRMRSWYLEQGVSTEIFAAVKANGATIPADFDQRIKAVQQFQTLAESEALIAANKRVSNLLKKSGIKQKAREINPQLLESSTEQQLANLLAQKHQTIKTLYEKANYSQTLAELASLKTPIDEFFDNVMVMVDDNKLRENRLNLLIQFQQLFAQVADISLL